MHHPFGRKTLERTEAEVQPKKRNFSGERRGRERGWMGCVGGTVEPPWGRGPTPYASYCNAKLKQNYPMARVRGRGSEARVGCRRRDTSPAGGCILTRLKNDLLKGPRPKRDASVLSRVHPYMSHVQTQTVEISPASDLLMLSRDDGTLIYIV